MTGSVLLSAPPKQRAVYRVEMGGRERGEQRGMGELSVCLMLFRDNALFNVPDLSGCVPPSPIQRVTLSHKASRR